MANIHTTTDRPTSRPSANADDMSAFALALVEPGGGPPRILASWSSPPRDDARCWMLRLPDGRGALVHAPAPRGPGMPATRIAIRATPLDAAALAMGGRAWPDGPPCSPARQRHGLLVYGRLVALLAATGPGR